MPYTLSMGLLWVASAVVLGIVMGWLMRSVIAKRQIERARSNHLDTVELERLRARVAELEPTLAERDQLRSELDRVTTIGAEPDTAPHPAAVPNTDPHANPDADPEDGVRAGDGAMAVAADPAAAAAAPTPSSPVAAVDLADAAAVLGAPVELDDLTVVEGIGPKVAELCTGIGIQTWHDLATTEVSLLRTMLHDAGPRFRSHDPSTWPEQAELLAAGRWAEFRAFTERHTEGSRR